MKLQHRESTEQQNGPGEQLGLKYDRRLLLKRTGMVLGTGGALAALALPSRATGTGERDELDGLWASVISAADNSFAPFKAFQLHRWGIWIGSGQTDLTPAALASSLWAVTRKIGPSTFHAIGRFWVYDPSANPTGYATVDQINIVSEDGKTYHGEGALQFFDDGGNSLGPPSPLLEDATRIAFL